ncbi:MAG: DUF11 domain-containing protein [Draconibacterium sp.]|nr:DUF11 domain-containing protein [Draconibacterium sp.]
MCCQRPGSRTNCGLCLTPLSASASLTVDKVRSNGTDPVTAEGDIIDYTITVQNTGGLTITGVIASDLLPDGSAGSLTGPTESISANSELNVGESADLYDQLHGYTG